MQRLHEQLQQSQQVAITAIAGMGGIGKTELALQYARAHWQQHYPGGVCWLEARDQDIATQILAFAQARLALTPSDDLPVKERIAYCWRNWPDFGDSPTAALVVIDDVSDYSAIEDYLPTHERFTLLLTTRQQRLATTVKTFAIEVLSEAAALELLRQLSEDPERIDAELEQAKALCEWLGYLPLGLELVGRYLAIDLDLSLANLQEQLDEQELEAEALTELAAGMTASFNLMKAIELSWQRLSPEAQELACLLGVFAPAPIPWPQVEACYPEAQGLACLLSVFAPAPIPSSQVEACHREIKPATLKRWRNLELLRLSLLQRVEQARYQLHPVVHRFIRTKLAEDSLLIVAYCRVMAKTAQEMEYVPTQPQIEAWRVMVPHVVEAATQWVSRFEGKGLFWPFTGLGRFYQGQGFYAQAEVWYERCVMVTQARLGNDHPTVASSLNNLALLYQAQGRYGEAKPLYLQSIDIGKASLGETHSEVAVWLNNLATLYSAQGRYGDAEPLALQALEITQASLGEAHPAMAKRLSNLALLYSAQGRYGDAEPLFLQAIDLGKARLGEAHPEVAKGLNNLALLYKDQGRYGDAESLFLQAINISKASLGETHPEVAVWLSNLATLYSAQGRYGDAEPLFLQAINISKARLGEAHPEVARNLNNLATLYKDQGRYGDAEPLFLQAINISKASLGEAHPEVARNLNNLATLYHAQRRYEEAKHLYIEALSIAQQRLGKTHPNTQTFQDNFVRCVRQALDAGQADVLSDYPMTQDILQQLQSQSG